jgi:mono/diheme cytochrome c family protein
MPASRRIPPLALVLGLQVLAGCGGKPDAAPPAAQASAAVGSDLTPFQLEHGIGPITEPVQLGPLDKTMAEAGEQIFTAKCSACH